MERIIPAILPADAPHLCRSIADIVPPAGEVQIDIVDGRLAAPASWPYAHGGCVEQVQQHIGDIAFEVDLMVERPEEVLDRWRKAGAAAIVVHIEGVQDMEAVCAHRRAHSYRLGVSLLNDTPLSVIMPFLDRVDYVQLMGISRIGSQGAPFDRRVLDRIRTLRTTSPDIPVSIDGAVREETIGQLAAAGAERFVVGSAIFAAASPHRAYHRLVALASEQFAHATGNGDAVTIGYTGHAHALSYR